MKKNKMIIIFLITTFFSMEYCFAQSNTLKKQSSPQLVLNNALFPTACLDYQNNVICCGIFWTTDFPLIAQKVDAHGNLLWPNNTFGVLLSYAKKAGDQTTHPFILPKADGGAFFAYEYLEFLEFDEYGTDIYFVHPMLQSVSPEGIVLWGNDGINLTDMNVRWFGGADVLELRYDNKGNVMVFWSWIDIDSIALPNIKATYLQKINPITGDLLLDSTGVKLFDELTYKILLSKCGNTYLFHRPWVLCINESGEVAWDLDLMTNITVPAFHAAINDSGDIFIIYRESDGIYGSLFNRDGEPIWQNILIVPGEMRFLASGPFVNWDNDKWVFYTDNHIHCIDKDGNNLWGDKGVVVNDTGFTSIDDINPVDPTNLMLVYDYYPGPGLSSKVQKINLNGEILWGDFGITIMGKVGTVAHLLPDSEGGAYIVIEGMAVYEPEYRTRGTYIEKVDKDGNLGFITSVQEKPINPIPIDYSLVNNYPNPFSDKTTISIKTNFSDKYFIVIYNLLGKEVRRLQVKNNSMNLVEIEWDGKDQNGSEVAEGIYFYRIGSKDKWFAAGKITYLKGF